MTAAVAHHRGVRNEDDVQSLSLGPSMPCRRVCSACARVQNAKVQSGRRSPWPLAHPSSIVIGCKRRGGGRFAVARTNVLLVQTACLPACVLSVYGLNCVAFAALPPMEMTGGSTTSQSRMLLPSLRYLLLPR
jgi:hypothetical protein